MNISEYTEKERDAYHVGIMTVLFYNYRKVKECSEEDPNLHVACRDFDCLANAVTVDLMNQLEEENDWYKIFNPKEE